jgi:hypothetical protein
VRAGTVYVRDPRFEPRGSLHGSQTGMNRTIPISTPDASGRLERLRQRFLAGDASFSDEEKLGLLLTFAIP